MTNKWGKKTKHFLLFLLYDPINLVYRVNNYTVTCLPVHETEIKKKIFLIKCTQFRNKNVEYARCCPLASVFKR